MIYNIQKACNSKTEIKQMVILWLSQTLLTKHLQHLWNSSRCTQWMTSNRVLCPCGRISLSSPFTTWSLLCPLNLLWRTEGPEQIQEQILWSRDCRRKERKTWGLLVLGWVLPRIKNLHCFTCHIASHSYRYFTKTIHRHYSFKH